MKAKKGGVGAEKDHEEGPVLLCTPLLGSDCDWARFKAAESCGEQLWSS